MGSFGSVGGVNEYVLSCSGSATVPALHKSSEDALDGMWRPVAFMLNVLLLAALCRQG